jgi:hypothetical protein
MATNSESNEDSHYSESTDTNTRKINEAVAFVKFEFCPHWINCVASYYDNEGKFLKNNDFWEDVFNEDVNDRINELNFYGSSDFKLDVSLTWVPNPDKFDFIKDFSDYAVNHNESIVARNRTVFDMEVIKGIFAFKIYRVDDESIDNKAEVPTIDELIRQFNL